MALILFTSCLLLSQGSLHNQVAFYFEAILRVQIRCQACIITGVWRIAVQQHENNRYKAKAGSLKV